MLTYATASTLYVSPDGDDLNSGLDPVTKGNGGPFRTLERAVTVVGHLRKTGIKQAYTIRVMGGTYELPDTLRFREDGGDQCTAVPASVTVEPYNGEPVTLSGGTAFDGFTSDVYNGVPCFSAPIPESCKNVSFSELYINGDRVTPNRYPANGYLEPEEVHNHNTVLYASSDWIIAKEGSIPPMPHPEDVTVSFGHYWIDEHTKIASYDKETRRLTFASSSRFTISPEAGAAAAMQYYLENIAADFGKTPGSWFCDRDAGKIYYYPKSSDEKPEDLHAVLPRLLKLVTVEGKPDAAAESVVFRNLNFAYTNAEYLSYGYPLTHDTGDGGTGESWYPGNKPYASDLQAWSDMHGAVELRYADHCAFYGCNFTCLGSHALNLSFGVRHTTVDSCTFRVLAAGGVRIAGDGNKTVAENLTHDNTVRNCEIADGGRYYLAACGVVVIHSAGNLVEQCSIHDFYYSGISCGWVWGYVDSATHHNVFRKNHIYNLGKGLLSDMGGVYLLGHQEGTVVANNIIHDVKCKVYGGWGLYTDEGSSFIRVEDNIVYNCSTNCYHQHYGSFNRLANNIFGSCADTPVIVSSRRNQAHIAMILENNIILSHGNGNYRNGNPTNYSSDYNLFFDTSAKDQNAAPYNVYGDKTVSIGDRYDYLGWDKHSMTADPGFRDPENGDFTLPADSPAYAIGFRSIETRDVGCAWDSIRK